MGEKGGCFLGSSGCAAGPLDQRKRLLHGDLPLPRCAELLGWGREDAAFGGAPAARGCSIEGGRRLLRGSSRCAG